MKFNELFGYQLECCLHDSGVVAVYRGQNTSNSETVILKVVDKGLNSEEYLNQLDNEYEILTLLDSVPGVPSVIDSVESSSHKALILYDVKGINLEDFCKAQQLSIEETVHLIRQCFSTIDAIHQHQVIHKDIKPSNILVDPLGQKMWFIDFGLAIRFSQKLNQYYHSTSVAGSLCYMSSEQTGRVNRQVDYRSDYYSIGVTAYKTLTGKLPFSTDQPDHELLYELLAKEALPPNKLMPSIPNTLSNIIMRLMEKDAENRYQTIGGILYDLDHCLDSESFILAQQDIPKYFFAPQKIYGREAEQAALKSAFKLVSNGTQQCVFVAGYSGVGKTALIHELYRDINTSQAFLLEGKFDQLQRNQPLYGFTKAFEDFFGSILTQPELEVAAWRKRISNALGENAGVVTQHIHNLRYLLGAQPEPLYLAGDEGFNRLIFSFKRLIQAIASVEHPLVIFIDDLQWIDDASLKLLEQVYRDNTSPYTLAIGAYRENEVKKGQPLFDFIQQAENRYESFRQIHLDNLPISATIHIIEDGFRHRIEHAEYLAKYLHEKTAGNPFFTIQFITQLIDDQIIHIERDSHWVFELKRLQEQAVAENVVALMMRKIQEYPDSVSELLFIAAAIGHEFSMNTLQAIVNKDMHWVKQTIMPALQNGLLVTTKETIKFAHDGIQRAALESPVSIDRPKLHHRIAQYLITQCDDSQALLNKHIFDICFHINVCQDVISNPKEYAQRIRLNIQAATQARQAAAFQAAYDYAEHAIWCLQRNQKTAPHPLSIDNALRFALYREAAECAYLIGKTEKAEQCLDLAFSSASNNFEKCQLMNLRIVQLISEGDYLNSMNIGITALNLYGIPLPKLDDIKAGIDYYAQKQSVFDQQWIAKGKSISELYDLPINNDPEIYFIMELLGSLYASALMSYPDYLKVITITLVDLSVQHGNTPISPIGYAWHGSSIAAMSEHYNEAYEFGQLAIRLNEQKIKNATISCKIYNMVGNFITFFKEPLSQALPLLRRGYELGLASGDKLYASYSIINEHRNALSTGVPLQDWLNSDDEIKVKLDLCDAQVMIEVRESFKAHVLRLMGNSDHRQSLNNPNFDEHEYREKYASVPLFGALLDSWKIQSSYLLDDYESALALSYFDVTPIDNFMLGTELRFFAALTLLHYLRIEPDHPDTNQRNQYLNQYLNRIELLATSCPENFSHMWNILQGEQTKITGDVLASAHFFNQAISSAHKHHVLHYEALANELLSDLYFNHQLLESAQSHIKQAYLLYAHWGSKEKLTVLQQRNPNVHFKVSPSFCNETSSSYLDQQSLLQKVDFNSLVEASLALSSEIEIDRLIDKLMTVAIENAGAQKCVLLMYQNQSWAVVAEKLGNHKSTNNLPDSALEGKLPQSIFNYVSRSNERLVLGDASSHKLYASDSYITTHQTKSLICVPLVHSGTTKAILYLENNLGKHAFNQDHIGRLELLSSQMAAALENAENYRLLSERELEYRSLLKSLPVGIIVCGPDARISYVNPLAYKLFNPIQKDVVGLNINDIEGSLFNDAGNLIANADNPVNIVLTHHSHLHGEVYGYQKPNETEPSWYMTSAFPQYIDGKIESVITCVVDVTERRKNQQKIQHLAYHDLLTDLPNRTYLETTIKQLISEAQSNESFSALIIMDVDNFKVINDSLGHWMGDKMLLQVVQRIQTILNDDIFFARLGGDEFALLFKNISPSIQGIKQRIEDTVSSIKASFDVPFLLGNTHVKTTASFGVSIIPDDGETVDTALRYADIALNQAKKGGRNKLSYFKEEHETELQREIELKNDLHVGIDKDQLSLVYQPKVDISTGIIIGAEALVRWHHPDKGMISPIEFIPIAEGSELINKLGQWVMNEACRQLNLWNTHPDFSSFSRMSINVSPFQFNSPSFMEGLQAILTEHKVQPTQLDVEVTENLLLEHTDLVIEKLNQLRAMGVTVSIDDFGTGYSSLSYLKRLPVDTLKVDQSFVFDMTENEDDRAIVQTILAMAKTLRLKTVAEGVESQAHLALLQQYDCDQYQGYFFSKPIAPKEFEALMKASNS